MYDGPARNPSQARLMQSFDELAIARKSWIQNVLRPWCLQACRAELLKAEIEWLDVAGKVSPEKTLWSWAWSRFPELVHENLGIEETSELTVTLRDGRVFKGFPDARKSEHGKLVVWGNPNGAAMATDLGPFSIDDISSVEKSIRSDESSR